MRVSMAAAVALLLLAGCGGKPPPPPQAPPQVAYVVIQPRSVTLSTELPGRTSAYESSDVRPQVNGIVRARLFEEGQLVHAGQPLYRIDAAPYQAAAASARAALSRARAAVGSTGALARRYRELVKINAISKQEAENATTGADQAKADVAAQQAAVRAAQVDLDRTTVRAPISGRIGRSAFTIGALVTASQTDALTTIQRLDPIYVDIQQSSVDILKLRQQLLAGALSRPGGAARVRLTLEDGSQYAEAGALRFAEVSVDPATGSQTVRAIFPNPRGLLLPGMFVRARLDQGTQASALLVPQRAVTRDEKGNPSVLVVGVDGKLAPRLLTATRTIGQDWLVTAGIRPGDKVVVEGAQNLRPGTPVKAVPFREEAAAGSASAAPSGASAG